MQELISKIEEIVNKWAWLGSRTLANGTKIIGHVKHMGPRAYLNKIYACVSDEEIIKLEHLIKRPLPQFFKNRKWSKFIFRRYVHSWL